MYTDPSGYDIAPYRDRHNRDEIEPLETLYLDRFGFDSDGNWWCTDGFGNSNGHIYDWTSFDNWIDEVRLERANRPDGPGEGENGNGAHGNYYDWKTGTYRSTFSRREVSWQYAIGVSLAADYAAYMLSRYGYGSGPMLACLGGGSDSGGEGTGSGVLSLGSTEQTFMLLGLSLTADGSLTVVNLFQQSNAAVREAALLNAFPTNQIDNIMAGTSKIGNGAQLFGRSVILISAGISIYQGYDAYERGDNAGVGKAGLDLGVGLGTAAIGGIPGVAIYIFYMGIMTTPPGNPSGYVTPTWVRDNTYLAPPVYIGH